MICEFNEVKKKKFVYPRLYSSFANELPGRPNTAGFEWLKVVFGKKPKTIVPDHRLRFVSRAFCKCNTNYELVSKALRQIASQDVNATLRSVLQPATKLVVRVNVPNSEAVKAMYARGTFKYFPARDKSLAETRSRTKIAWLEKRTRQRANECDALEARLRMKRNDFIPYFHCNSYEPLKNYFAVNNLSYYTRSI